MTEFVQYALVALSVGALYALLALGVALIFGIMRFMNFAHGELIMIGAYTLFFSAALPWPIMVGMAAVVVILASLGMERVAFRPLRGASTSTLLISSFALSYFLQNLTLLIYGSRPKSVLVAPILSDSVSVGGVTVAALDIVTIATVFVLLFALAVFLKRTRLGIEMRAAAEDFTTARLLGVKANRVIATAFALSGLVASVASVLLVAQTGTLTPRIGVTPVVTALIATILGGLGSLEGAVLGGFALGILTIALQVSLPIDAKPYRDAFVYGGVILLLLIRPRGLLPARHLEERV